MFESTYVIAERQFDKALELFDDVASYVEVTGPISFIHQVFYSLQGDPSVR